MIVRTNLLRRTIRDLYRENSYRMLNDTAATIDQLVRRSLKLRGMYRNDLHSIQNVETIARSYH